MREAARRKLVRECRAAPRSSPNLNRKKHSMTEPVPKLGPFPLAIPDDGLRETVQAVWEARCNVRVWADPERVEQATGYGATWRWDGHQRGTVTCAPCGSFLIVDRLSGYTVDDLTAVIGQRLTCRAVAPNPLEQKKGTE
jgi:hypothetical protein